MLDRRRLRLAVKRRTYPISLLKRKAPCAKHFDLHYLIVPAIGSAAAFAARPSQPNIIFILADDFGIGDLKFYNQDSRIPTPN